jgi:putative PIN family toxin of toxin-antitoxin system
MKNKNVKVIFDTNVWISFLIGKRLNSIQKFISEKNITVVTTEQLVIEIKLVTQRDKLKKYFHQDDVNELLELLSILSLNVKIKHKNILSRDPKDNFLLDSIEFSNADYLVTGDKDLLELSPFMTAKILTPSNFEKEIESIFNHQ